MFAIGSFVAGLFFWWCDWCFYDCCCHFFIFLSCLLHSLPVTFSLYPELNPHYTFPVRVTSGPNLWDSRLADEFYPSGGGGIDWMWDCLACHIRSVVTSSVTPKRLSLFNSQIRASYKTSCSNHHSRHPGTSSKYLVLGGIVGLLLWWLLLLQRKLCWILALGLELSTQYLSLVLIS